MNTTHVGSSTLVRENSMREVSERKWWRFCAVFAASTILSVSCSPNRPTPPGFYRFDDNLDKATAVDVSPVDSVEDVFRFEFDEADPSGWTVPHNGSCEVRDGALVATARDVAFIASPGDLEIDTSAAHSILIRMKVEGADWVVLDWKWVGAQAVEERNRFRIHVARPGQWFSYNIRTSGLDKWEKPDRTVSQLRFMVPCKARVEIDHIRLLSRRAHFALNQLGVTHYALNGHSRSCLYTHCPGEIEYRLAVPEEAYISVGLGIVESDPPVEFSVAVKQDGTARDLFNRQVGTNKRWSDAKIDMTAYANKEVDIVFRTDCQGGRNIALWSNPILYQAKTVGRSLSRQPSRDRQVNVILYLIDALRADHLDAYGYSRKTSPAITDLANAGALFARCFSQETWTKPSVASLFTGTSAGVHGVRVHCDTVPRSMVVLPEILRSYGYATASFSTNSHMGPITDLTRGFSYFEKAYLLEREHCTREAAAFLEKYADRKFFMYVHTVEPHYPYSPPEQLAHRFAAPGEAPTDLDLYDAEIVYADANLEHLVSKLRELGIHDNTLLIVTADHGEAFGEHEGMIKHSGKPYNELIHIPLIMHLPGSLPAGKVVAHNVQLIDIAPTILDVLNIRGNEQFQGMSLLPLIEGGSADAFRGRTVYSVGKGMTAVIKDNWKLLCGKETKNLYDLSVDFGETKNVASKNESVVESLEKELSNHQALQSRLAQEIQRLRRDKDTALDVDPRAIERLKALGYLK